MDNLEQHWLTIFACQCPQCGYPRVEHAISAFPPAPESLKELKLAMLPCVRCQWNWQPSPPECCLNIVAVPLKKDFRSYTPDK
jgi:hypothetical protein